MRNTSETNFPFLNPTNCYFTVNQEGFIVQHPHKGKYDRTMLAELADIAKTGKVTIYAVWPGKWSSDLFIIDNLDDFKHAMTSI